MDNGALIKQRAVILSLSAINSLGPVRIRSILARAADPGELLLWSVADFSRIDGISAKTASEIVENLSVDYGEKILAWVEDKGYNMTTICDIDYPEKLKKLYDAPPFLFCNGNLTDSDIRAISIVGSRMASDYGKRAAHRLASELAGHGISIVSGMALGIDSAAHRGALAGRGRTIAVLGSGIDVIYPFENTSLYDEIAEHGAVVSEFLPGTTPHPGNFPRRNRVIAALAEAVIVVEAGNRSGALLTADLASAQDKKLFAVPGPITSRMSEGTNELIKSGVPVLTSVEDIFSLLPELKNDYIAPVAPVVDDLSPGESKVLEILSDIPVQLDTLVRRTGFSVPEATAYICSLELRGLIRTLSGKRYTIA